MILGFPACPNGDRIPLYVGCLMELEPPWWADYARFFPKLIEHTMAQIKNRGDVLSEYELKLIVENTQNEPGLAAKQLFEMVTKSPPKVALLGPTLSTPLSITGQITPFYNITQISFIATTSVTVSEDLYSTLFRINFVDNDVNPVRIALMKHYGWKKVGTLLYQSEISISQMDKFHELLKANNFTLLTSVLISNIEDMKDYISRLKAYRQGLYGSKYVWILTGSSMYHNWINSSPEDSLPCPLRQLIEAAWGHFLITNMNISPEEKVTISGMVPNEFSSFTNNLSASLSGNYLMSDYSSLVYDATWALALGLNNSLKYLGELRLENYNYSTPYLNSVMKGMHEVEFRGISKPEDQFLYTEIHVPYSMPALILVLVLNSIGVVTALAFLAINVIYRNNRTIKMSSPSINNVLIVGSLIMYLAVYIVAIDYSVYGHQKTTRICMLETWSIAIGFTTVFGSLFSKTWRVYVIFRHTEPKKRNINDKHLLLILALFLSIDLVILVPWTFINPLFKAEIRNLSSEFEDNNIILTNILTYCHNDNQSYWFAALYIFKGLLLAFGTFIAWETRMVQVPALNDSKLIGFCIYNVVVVCAFGVTVQHALPSEQTTLQFLLLSICIVFCTTLVLYMLFLPKMKYRTQVGDRFILTSLQKRNEDRHGPFSLSVASTLQQSSAIASSTEANAEKIMSENKRLRMEIAMESIAIAKLKRTLLAKTGNLHIVKVNGGYQIEEFPMSR
ncbi:hypothetical protein ACJMK2_019956 [Sinanodonta woodiana]|uniref:G-protein coupled receptors family 3 profile domain-containing protein n=1 Tax=Sinanodonta woodiana TaxID=1069815 RepID=A0ABD3TXH6_SINWO